MARLWLLTAWLLLYANITTQEKENKLIIPEILQKYF
jgi:hypothetical protein